MLTTAGALRLTAAAKLAAGCSHASSSPAVPEAGRDSAPAASPEIRGAGAARSGQNFSAAKATTTPPSTEPATKRAYCRRRLRMLMAQAADGRVKALVYNAGLTGPQGSADLVAGFRP